MPVGVIDEEAVSLARAMIGIPLRRDRLRWVRTATPDAIRHFVWGIGDDNPLWTDEEYAGGTRWGGVIAPPCFLYAVDSTIVAPKLPGVQWIYAGTDWTWWDVVRCGDDLDSSAALTAVEEKSGRTFPHWVLQEGEVSYFTPEGRQIALARSSCARTPRGEQLEANRATQPEKPPERIEPRYTPEELLAIEEAVLSEAPRGAEKLWWEDVAVGDELPDVVKGPLSIVDIVAWYAATQGAEPYGGAHGRALRYRRRHQDWHVNPETGAADAAGRGHLEARTGNDVGMGGAYDVGPQRISWSGQMLTNWMGDDGFLHRLSVVLHRPNLVGDTIWWRGAVTGKIERAGTGFVEIDIKAANQSGKNTASGKAVVALPSRTHGDVRLPLVRESA
jgi:acyl dehydratase